MIFNDIKFCMYSDILKTEPSPRYTCTYYIGYFDV